MLKLLYEAEMLHLYAVLKPLFVIGSRQLFIMTLQNEILINFHEYLVFSQSARLLLATYSNDYDFKSNFRWHENCNLHSSEVTNSESPGDILSYVALLLTKNTTTKNVPEL